MSSCHADVQGGCQESVARGDPTVAMTLPGPSRTIIVEPIEQPGRAPAPREPAPEREPAREPSEPEPAPAEPEREREKEPARSAA